MKKELEIQGLGAHTPFIDAAAAIILDRLDNMLAHESGVRDGSDIEELHDMRVFSRRLREALKIFKPCYSGKQFKKVYSGVRDVTRALGDVRNLDVFIEYFTKFKENDEPDPARAAAADALMGWAESRRKGLRKKMIKDLDEVDTAQLSEDIRAMLSSPRPEEPEALLKRFAAEGLPVARTGGPGAGVDNAELVTLRPGDDGFAEAAARELLGRGCIRPRDYKEYRDVAREIETPGNDEEMPLLLGDTVLAHAARLVPPRLNDVAALWREAQAARETPDIDILHSLRISFKKIRYALESLYPAFDPERHVTVYRHIKEFQDILGDMHDADVFYELGCKKMKDAVKKDNYESAIGYALLAHRLRLRRDELAGVFYQTSDTYSLDTFEQDVRGAFRDAQDAPQ